MQEIDLEIKQQSLLERHDSTGLPLFPELLCTAKLNWTDLTCGLQPPSLKNTVEDEQSAVVRWQV